MKIFLCLISHCILWAWSSWAGLWWGEENGATRGGGQAALLLRPTRRRCWTAQQPTRERETMTLLGFAGKKMKRAAGKGAGRLGQRNTGEEYPFLFITGVFQMHFQIHLKQFEVYFQTTQYKRNTMQQHECTTMLQNL